MEETILILGADGYIGWSAMMYFGKRNNGKVVGVDNMSKRKQLKEVKTESLTSIKTIDERIKTYEKVFNKTNVSFHEFDITDSRLLEKLLKKIKPTVILNLAQMPSAPYSMIDLKHATWTNHNNVVGNLNLLWLMKDNCPDAHLIKMGTMGEYGTPNIDIAEGFFEVEYHGRKDTLPFPKQAGSFYHWAKVFETQHTNFASKIWGLRATDLMQGVVYGVTTEESKMDEKLINSFYYDGIFGTAINRFVSQAISGQPITPFGKGKQTRSFLNIKDSMQCFELYIMNPPKKGEYRVFNQLVEQHRTVNELAKMVQRIAKKKGYDTTIKNIPNPRIENEDHYYNAETSKLDELGLKPCNFEAEIEQMFDDLAPYKDKIDKKTLVPKVKWK